MPRGVYPKTLEHNAKNSTAKKKFHQEHPGFHKEQNNRPDIKVKNSIGQKKFHQLHPGYNAGKNNVEFLLKSIKYLEAAI